MSINTKTKAAVDTLLTDDATTEAQFKTGLQDVTSEVDSLNTGTVKTTTSFTGDVSGTYNATVVANDSHTHDTRYYTETEINNMFSGATDKTGYNNDNWDASYGWGDHGLEGYLTDVNVSDIVAEDLLISSETFVDSDNKLMSAAAVDDRITARLPSDAPPSSTERTQWDSAYDAVILGTVNVNIEQGAIDGTSIGATTASTGAFTTLSTSGQATLDSLSVSNNVGITGNLTVSGTTTSLETTNTNITDRILTLNKGMTSSETNTQDMGFYFYRGDQSGPAFYFDESEDKFRFTYPSLDPSPSPGTSVNPTPLSYETAHTFYNTTGNYVDIQGGNIEGTSGLLAGIVLNSETENSTNWGYISRSGVYGSGLRIKGGPLEFYGHSIGDSPSIAGKQNNYGWDWYNAYGNSVTHHETNFIYEGTVSDNETPVQLNLQAKDDSSTIVNLVSLQSKFLDVTSTSKDTQLVVKTFSGNTQYDALTLTKGNANFTGVVSALGLLSQGTIFSSTSVGAGSYSSTTLTFDGNSLDYTYAGFSSENSTILNITSNPVGPGSNISIYDGILVLNRNDSVGQGLGVFKHGIAFGTETTKATTLKDEDDMASNSATALATQQSIKAYVDNEIANVGGVNSGYVKSSISLGGFAYPSSSTSPINYTFNTPGNYIVVTLNFTANLNADGDEENAESVTVALEYSLDGGTSYSTFTSVSKTSKNTSFSNVTTSDATGYIPTPNATTTIHFRIRKTSGTNAARASSSSVSGIVMRDYDLASWPSAN